MTKNSERKRPEPDLCFYHWSPTARRKQIIRYGFRPGSISLDRDWHPPHTCFSDEPVLAWVLSGRLHPEITEWDLWMVFAYDCEHFEAILDTFKDSGRHYVKEYRVYHPIPKRYVRYIASRSG